MLIPYLGVIHASFTPSDDLDPAATPPSAVKVADACIFFLANSPFWPLAGCPGVVIVLMAR
jgi:hypothetical protein